MTLVDSHCHLDHEKLRDDLDGVLDRAATAGVTRMLTIGTGDGPPELDRAVALAHRFPQVLATVGVHPHHAAKTTAAAYDELQSLARDPRVVAIGEIGLDYHYEFSPREQQREAFLEQIRMARDAGKPVIVHTRQAWEDTMTILRGEWRGRMAILHCFTGTPDQALEAVSLGFFLGFGGVLTFPKSEGLREAARLVPARNLLLETDAPYLAPVPVRGKRNEPAFTAYTAACLAGVRGVSPGEIAALTAANFERFLGSQYTGVSDGAK